MQIRSELYQLFNKAIDLVFGLCVLAVVWLTAQVFLFASFKIPSDSMAPELLEGDNVIVWKPTIGARLFDVFATLRLEQTEIYRLPGFRDIRRNDVLVFNYPYPKFYGKQMQMHILKYYIKRCIALPGDSLEIRNGFFQVKGVDTPLGNRTEQAKIAAEETKERGEQDYFPNDTAVFDWDMKEFGPLYIPGKGDSLAMSREHVALYKNLIEWEQKGSLEWRDSAAWLKGKRIAGYRFQKDYYFMAGDNGLNSLDSRYWGLVPEEYIVGKAWLIWKSVDIYTEEVRWERFLKLVE